MYTSNIVTVHILFSEKNPLNKNDKNQCTRLVNFSCTQPRIVCVHDFQFDF